MCAAKASAVSDEELAKALLGSPKAKLVQKSGNQSKATEKNRSPVTSVVRKTGLLDIKDPGYDDKGKEEYRTGELYSSSARVTVVDKVFITPAFVIKNIKDPKLSSLDGRSLLKLSLFIMNGISDDYLLRAIAYSNSLPDIKGTPASVIMRDRFRQDFVGDALRARIADLTNMGSVGYSRLYRYAMCLIGILSEDGVLDDVLKEAIDLQHSFGMDILTKEK